jgi:replicative DNA helicase
MIDPSTETPDLKHSRRRKANGAPNGSHAVDRLPPHSIEAEQGVLGAILLSPNENMGECLSRIKVGSEVFYDLRHQTIFAAMVEMFDRREGIDLITLQQHLKDRQQLDQVGGIAYLSSLPDSAPTSAFLDFYLKIVQDKFILRRMVRVCTEAVGRIYDYEGEVDQILDEVERDVLRINEFRVQSQINTIKQLVNKAITTIEDYHGRQGKLTGLPTGFTDLDKLTTGLHGGEMIVIAARPSVGKTSLAMNIAEHVAIEHKIPVGVFSLEMTADSLILRMLCSNARVNLRNVREGFLLERDFPKLTMSAGKLAGAPLFIDDSSGLSILQLRAKARRMFQQYGIKLFVIDYLQLLRSSARTENRQQEIADISAGIKALAKELNVPVIVLSQLNREVEREKGRPPRLSDLRESGSIEQDADLVGLLYRPAKPGEDEDLGPSQPSDAIPVNLLIAKQRNGPADEDVNLTFLKIYTRFENAAKIHDADVPGN